MPTSPPLQPLGPRLRALIAARGLSVSEAARRAGMPQPNLARLLAGDRPNPGVLTVGRVLAAIAATWADLDG